MPVGKAYPENPRTLVLGSVKQERKSQMLKLRIDKNLTYSQIGRLFGVSRQRIYQILGPDLEKIEFKRNQLLNRAFERINIGYSAKSEERVTTPQP